MKTARKAGAKRVWSSSILAAAAVGPGQVTVRSSKRYQDRMQGATTQLPIRKYRPTLANSTYREDACEIGK